MILETLPDRYVAALAIVGWYVACCVVGWIVGRAWPRFNGPNS